MKMMNFDEIAFRLKRQLKQITEREQKEFTPVRKEEPFWTKLLETFMQELANTGMRNPTIQEFALRNDIDIEELNETLVKGIQRLMNKLEETNAKE